MSFKSDNERLRIILEIIEEEKDNAVDKLIEKPVEATHVNEVLYWSKTIRLLNNIIKKYKEKLK